MSSQVGPSRPGGVKEQLGTIFKQISEAQTLDINGDEMGAYRHYLSSIGLAAQVLSADIQANQGQGTLPEQQVQQLYKMVRDCLDRSQAIFTSARKEQRPLALFRLATPSPTSPLPTYRFPPSLPSQQSHPSPQPTRHASLTMPRTRGAEPPQSSMFTSQSVRVGQAGDRNMSWPASRPRVATTAASLPRVRGYDAVDGIPGDSEGPAGQLRGQGDAKPEQHRSQPINTVHTMSFMAEAKLRNRHMMEQYKSHLRQQYTGKPIYNEAGLSMLRRLEENLSVARIREQNIAKRLKEKEQRAREAGAKTKPAVLLSALTMEELAEQVLSFEHGKQKIASLKAHLNGSNSDPSIVYGIISEILSISDHPLSRLFGEYQYRVYMMLQPVGAAVEKAGGLPQLDIRLDNSGLDRKPSIEEKPHPQPGESHDLGSGDESDTLLELLCDDDEEDLLLPPSLGNALTQSKDKVAASDTFDSKFERLKNELMGGANNAGGGSGGEDSSKYQNGQSSGDEDQFGSNGVGPVYENTDQSDSHDCKNVTLSRDDDKVLSQAPMFDSYQEEEGGVSKEEETFDLRENECYEAVGKAPRTELAADSEPTVGKQRNENVYHDADAVLRYLEEERQREEAGKGEGPDGGKQSDGVVYRDADAVLRYLEGEREEAGKGAGPGGTNGDDSNHHDYEVMDSVFSDNANVGHHYDLPDGGLLSRQAPPIPPELEMEEMVTFNNLPPLICNARLGDEVAMRKLADTAASVLSEVVKHIHTSLDKLLQCFCKCYSLLNCEENQEVCRTVLEASFFPAILSPLTIVYRCKNYCDEVAIAKNMCQQVNASPRDLSVRKKYWLLEQSHAPYGEAIDELRRVTGLQYPSPKLECLVHMSKQIIKCIDDYYMKYHPESKLGLVGVDDMLPILSYVILRSGLPQLISECSIMEEFIQDGYIMGEEGFCLTSFLTALKYVTQMSS